jgi:hypothetical protein
MIYGELAYADSADDTANVNVDDYAASLGGVLRRPS